MFLCVFGLYSERKVCFRWFLSCANCIFETWVYHYELQFKQDSMEGHQKDTAAPKELELIDLATKFMAINLSGLTAKKKINKACVSPQQCTSSQESRCGGSLS